MKRVYILLVCILLLPKLLRAQTYIELNKENTFHYNNSYLIDIPLKQARGNLLIKDSVEVIPFAAYSKLLHEIDNISFVNRYNLNLIFIIKELKNKTPVKQGISNRSLNEYVIKYYPKGDIDTLNKIDDKLTQYKPLLNWKSWTNRLKLDSVLIYYSEYYGSGCCPQDTRYAGKITLTDFINEFEKIHQIKIGEQFYIIMGEEGEHIVYLTLSGLTPEQKIQFIDERKNTLISDRKEMDQPTIYAPYWIPISMLKKR